MASERPIPDTILHAVGINRDVYTKVKELQLQRIRQQGINLYNEFPNDGTEYMIEEFSVGDVPLQRQAHGIRKREDIVGFGKILLTYDDNELSTHIAPRFLFQTY